jgi:hypothetical protein
MAHKAWSITMSRTKMLIALAALTAVTAPASARTARHFQHRQVAVQYPLERPPLTVTKRSWLDYGNVTPAGDTTPNYVFLDTVFNQTPDQVFNTAAFGNDRLPVQRPLEVPGRPSPVLMYTTGGPSVFRLDFVLAPAPVYPYYPYWP